MREQKLNINYNCKRYIFDNQQDIKNIDWHYGLEHLTIVKTQEGFRIDEKRTVWNFFKRKKSKTLKKFPISIVFSPLGMEIYDEISYRTTDYRKTERTIF